MTHRVYEAIVREVKNGSLNEPFSRDNFRASCPGFGKGTYNAFLDRHAVEMRAAIQNCFFGFLWGSSNAFARSNMAYEPHAAAAFDHLKTRRLSGKAVRVTYLGPGPGR